MIETWMWFAFVGLALGLLSLDLFVFHRDAHTVSVREATIWSAIWIALGVGFGGVIWAWLGAERGGEYFAGYLIEKALSVDNIFVFAMVFAYFAVPAAYQHRVLFWGVVGAIILRAIFIVAGAELLQQFHWLIYVFGVILLATGAKMAFGGDTEVHPERNPVLKLVRRFIPITSEFEGQRFFVRSASGVLMATPLFAVLLIIETTDVVFAIDSIPAIFAVTQEPFIVFASNAFAILGLRSLYFVLADLLYRFKYLKVGLGGILLFAGTKMMLSETPYKIDIWLSLGVIGVILAVSVIASLIATRQEPAPGPAANPARRIEEAASRS